MIFVFYYTQTKETNPLFKLASFMRKLYPDALARLQGLLNQNAKSHTEPPAVFRDNWHLLKLCVISKMQHRKKEKHEKIRNSWNWSHRTWNWRYYNNFWWRLGRLGSAADSAIKRTHFSHERPNSLRTYEYSFSFRNPFIFPMPWQTRWLGFRLFVVMYSVSYFPIQNSIHK